MSKAVKIGLIVVAVVVVVYVGYRWYQNKKAAAGGLSPVTGKPAAAAATEVVK